MGLENYYRKRIHQSLNFINENLGNQITINQVANAAHFSTYHFQRIFRSIMNESPYETILRLRLEKAVFYFKHYNKLKVSEVAEKCGFESPENFTRQFKSRFNISPSLFKKDKKIQNSRIYQEEQEEDFYHYMDENRYHFNDDFRVELEELPQIDIAYVKAIFGADGSGLVQRYLDLVSWAEKNKINYKGPLTRFGMSIDNPDVTPVGKYRYDFGLRLTDTENLNFESYIELGEIIPGLYATLQINGKLDVVSRAWDYLYKVWLPNSKYVPAHAPALEEFIKGPEEIGWENFNIKCRIPLEEINLSK